MLTLRSKPYGISIDMSCSITNVHRIKFPIQPSVIQELHASGYYTIREVSSNTRLDGHRNSVDVTVICVWYIQLTACDGVVFCSEIIKTIRIPCVHLGIPSEIDAWRIEQKKTASAQPHVYACIDIAYNSAYMKRIRVP